MRPLPQPFLLFAQQDQVKLGYVATGRLNALPDRTIHISSGLVGLSLAVVEVTPGLPGFLVPVIFNA